MASKRNILFISIVLFAFKLSAQSIATEKSKDTSSVDKLFFYDVKQILLGAKYSISRPLHWKKKDFTTLGIVLSSALALSTVDDETSTYFVRQKPPDLFQKVGFYSGKPQVYFLANAGLYGYGLFTKNEKIRKLSVLIIASSITSGFLQSLSKTAIGRVRPLNGYKSNKFSFWSKEAAFHSFPSGHTVLSVTMAHAVAKQLDNPWSKVAVYSLGAISPASRLFEGAHWLTDVGIGAVLSIVVVDSVDKFLFKTNAYKYNKKQKNISWNINFTGNQIGLIGTF